MLNVVQSLAIVHLVFLLHNAYAYCTVFVQQPIEVVAAPIVAELVQNARNSNVSRFQQLVSDNVGSDTGWQAIARMFRLTQSAVQMAGMGTAVARQIKEMTLNYFEDRFANWIVDQGGWV